MPNPKAPRFLVDVRDEASGYLGRELTDSEWAEAYPPAAQKLSRIIQLYGDNGGDRRQPWYLGKLVQEHIAFSIISAYPVFDFLIDCFSQCVYFCTKSPVAFGNSRRRRRSWSSWKKS